VKIVSFDGFHWDLLDVQEGQDLPMSICKHQINQLCEGFFGEKCLKNCIALFLLIQSTYMASICAAPFRMLKGEYCMSSVAIASKIRAPEVEGFMT